jgi:hypothetical protein
MRGQRCGRLTVSSMPGRGMQFRPWTPDEDARLVALSRAGHTATAIAEMAIALSVPVVTAYSVYRPDQDEAAGQAARRRLVTMCGCGNWSRLSKRRRRSVDRMKR